MNPTNDQIRQASPSIFDAQQKPSKKAMKAMKKWRDKEATTEAEKEWCDAALEAMKQAKKGGWE